MQVIVDVAGEDFIDFSVLSAACDDYISILFVITDELVKHGLDGSQILRRNVINGTSTLVDIALNSAQQADIGIDADIELEIHHVAKASVIEGVNAFHDDHICRMYGDCLILGTGAGDVGIDRLLHASPVSKLFDMLAEQIESAGVAVSLDHQPDAGFLRDDKVLYTEFVKDEFVSGKSMTSVLINNILEANNANNANRGETGIYATAYIVFEDGTEAGCTAVDNGNVSHSLRSVMELIDGSQKAYLENKQAVDNFYTKWESVMGAWGLENITGATASPAADDTLNILMIGNSYSYYYVQELYDLLAQDGIKANVYNLYKSGCTLEEHYNWWMSGYNGYQFFWKTNEDGYNLVNGNTTMAESLLAENWDVISIQESLFKNIASATTEDLLAQNEVYREKLIPMLKNAFPNAQIYWHQQCGPEAGFRMESTAYGLIEVPDADAQLAYANKEREAAQFISERYGIKIVNTGDAWQTIRTTPEYAAMLTTGGLCARIGENNFAGTDGGDGYHDGDIGGGQYLNACVWYETLTGESCVGKTFKVKTYHNDKDVAYAPYYELSAELVDALQKVAHATVNKQEV